MAAQLKLFDFGIGASPEFNAQKKIMKILTLHKLEFQDNLYNIKFSCPIIEDVGPVISISDPLHAKKNAQNALFSGAQLLTFGHTTACYNHIVELSQNSDTDNILYKRDVKNVDHQDDEQHIDYFILLVIAYRDFYSKYLFVPWMYGSEGCEHFFGLAHQLLSEFLFNDLIALVPKISYLYKAYTSESISVFQEKTSATNENNSDEILNSINSNQESLDDVTNIENLFILIVTTEINKDNWELPDNSYLDYEEGQSNVSFISQSALNLAIPIMSDILDNKLFIK
ncbi:hypothetical protein C2G38_2213156 [Gigaspora rosea]|uniref:Uncharacterized protein n=1 Tax=Gigaspora rosea TaxID=44941 RepID=A0A397UL71_9GLOM|nr:hypothetical protein C2G38_2213156 [Gigaspora rosea]